MTLLYLTSVDGPTSLAACIEPMASTYGPLACHSLSESSELCPTATVLVAELNRWSEFANSLWLARLSNPELTSIIICHQASEPDACAAIDAGASNFVSADLTARSLPLLVAATHKQQQKSLQLQQQLQQCRQQLSDRIIIEKAKGMLMQTRGCSENDAYQQLRRQAMQHQLPMIKLARQLLSVKQLLQP
ncbi:ANTAR domain-containing response regulator [Gilvimarinus agarilyticus]|uniref:ANTAR domain-containing response regulator n=1 Tax=Gilvimarinus agarilyticus TaxID=679259 RepID=UPI0006984378|nr:GAF and ANTAR domain-containing protein [Gilvimarinus agarilyticus]